MNSRHIISIGLTLLIFSSCLKTEILQPTSFPLMLRNDVELTEVFEDGTLLSGGADGFYIDYGNGLTAVLESSSQSEFSENQVDEMMFYLGADQVIYGVNLTYVLVIKPNGYHFFFQDLVNNSNLTYPGYTITPKGELMRCDYSEQIYNSEEQQYFHNIRLSIWDDDVWDTDITDIWMQSAFNTQYTPTPIFEGKYDLYIAGNEIFSVDYSNPSYLTYERLVPSNGVWQYSSFHHGRFYEGELLGFDQDYVVSSDIQYSYSFNLNSGLLRSYRVTNTCYVGDDQTFNISKVIGSSGRSTFCYQQRIFNSFSEDNVAGLIIEYDHSKGKCDVRPLIATGLLENTNLVINDVSYDVEADVIYLATQEGLIGYDMQTNQTFDYLSQIVVQGETN
jgi:hypothetical protein